MKQEASARFRFARPQERTRLQQWNIEETAERVFFTTTADGWQLAISHYRDNGLNPAHRRHPVLLCHGLGANRLLFDIDRQHSFAAWLLEQGYDVYAVDLRSHGLSEKPGQAADKHWDWGFNAYCDADIPAAIDAVLADAGASALHFVGHSMGGILLYCHAAQSDPRIVSGIAIAASLDYSGHPSIFHGLSRLVALTHIAPSMPLHWSSLAGSVAATLGRRFMSRALVNPSNVDRQVYRRLTANLLHPISSRLLRDMQHFVSGKGLQSSRHACYRQQLQHKGYAFPILSLSGTADAQCPPASAARFGTRHQVFGRAYGQRHDYGHLDLIMGKHARKETWPCMGAWLDRHDQPATQTDMQPLQMAQSA